MSKKYKGKLCVYCGKAKSTLGEHVIAREFFLEAERANLPKVPSCDPCNTEKSKVEHYFTAVAPFGGVHPSSKENLTTQVPKRLENNQRLHRELSEGAGTSLIHEGEAVSERMTLPIDFEKVQELYEYIGKGLLAFHFGVILPPTHAVWVLALTAYGEEYFERKYFSIPELPRVSETIAGGAFWYEGIQEVKDPAHSAWRMQLYGGVSLADDTVSPPATTKTIGVVTAPRSVLEKVLRK